VFLAGKSLKSIQFETLAFPEQGKQRSGSAMVY
jgi:hypothetical protein